MPSHRMTTQGSLGLEKCTDDGFLRLYAFKKHGQSPAVTSVVNTRLHRTLCKACRLLHRRLCRMIKFGMIPTTLWQQGTLRTLLNFLSAEMETAHHQYTPGGLVDPAGKLWVSFLDMYKRESMDLKVNQAYQIHEKGCLGDYTISATTVLCNAASWFLMCPPTLLCMNGTCRTARCARKTGLAALLLV